MYLEKYGNLCLENGYNILPIVPGTKAPGVNYQAKNWSAVVSTPKKLKTWISGSKGNTGIGILTKHNPAVDIDCYDPVIVKKMTEFIEERLGATIERIGHPPKKLMVFRTDEPFPKVQSHTYLDQSSRPVKCEILADGQQFVALAIHPDTKEPYRWLNKSGVHDTKSADLPLITREDAVAISDYFNKLAKAKGWIEKKSLKRMTGGQIDFDDPFIHDAPKVDLNESELRSRLLMVPDCDDYDLWLQVGMALYHQFDGDNEGLTLWHEWSSPASNYDAKALDEKWGSFDVEGKNRQPTTARIILKLANEEETRLATEQLSESLDNILSCQTLEDLKKVCHFIKSIAFDMPSREMIAGKVKAKYKDITDVNLSPTMAREMVRYENQENRNPPIWLSGFVYIQLDETFYHPGLQISLSTKAFDQSYARHMLTKKDQLEGKSTPDHLASHYALNVCRIPVVYNRMYMPGDDNLFSINDRLHVNSYSDRGVPLLPDKIDKYGQAAIDRVERHVRHLFASERDGGLLMDWIAYIVQTRGRVNWAPLLQGVQGDGKTFFHTLMGCVLGAENVIMIDGSALEEKYTPWAEGHLLVFVEEVRLHGLNRWDVVNRLKPNIANSIVKIRRMQTDVYNVINRSSYIATTNSRDGLPLHDSDNRYFPMFSRFQTKEALDEFNLANPEYFSDLYAVVDEAPALRKWLMERQLSDEFDPSARATVSASRQEMIELNMTDEQEALRDALTHDAQRDFSKKLLDANLMAEMLTGRGASCPSSTAKKRLLSEAGFTYLGSLKVDGELKKLWSQNPAAFRSAKGEIDSRKVISWLSDEL